MENVLPTTLASKPASRSPTLQPDAILQDRYRIIRQLGKGGMGAVYEAVDQRLDAIVALKETASGQIALLDFGLAKTQTTDLSGNSSSSIFGYTRRYSPLEQIQDQGTSPQSDIYALGATLYHLLTGIKPPDALARAAALANSKTDPLMLANEVHHAVGSEIARILCRAMALSAEDRYADASEFRDALRQVGRGDAPVRSAKADPSIAQSARDRTLNIK